MKLSFYGADQCVTGSCHCLEVNGKNILIDCGLQQGRDEVNNEALPFHPGSIDFVLITHAHIDHTGRVPMLVKQGFQGRIWTPPTFRSPTPSGKTARRPVPAPPRWSRCIPLRTRKM